MSQITDGYGYALSSFEGLPLDALQYLTPDDTLYQRESQFDSVLDLPDLLDNQVRSRAGPRALDTLTRIKPDSINEYIVFTTDMSAEFVKWWLQTDFGKKKRLNWEVSRRADCWTGFQQVAHTKDGKPGVMCNRCRTVLTYPATNHTGNSSMQKYLDGLRCRQRITKKGNIQQLLSDAVYSK